MKFKKHKGGPKRPKKLFVKSNNPKKSMDAQRRMAKKSPRKHLRIRRNVSANNSSIGMRSSFLAGRMGASKLHELEKRIAKERNVRDRLAVNANAKHHVIKFKDTYDGESAFLFAVNARMRGLDAKVSKVGTDRDGSIYRVSIIKNERYWSMSDEERAELERTRQHIVDVVRKHDERRRIKLMKGAKVSSTDLERDAPELYRSLPIINRENLIDDEPPAE